MAALGGLVEGGGAVLPLWHVRGIRAATRRGESLMPAQLHIPLLLGLAVIVVPAVGVSPLQLLWIDPLCYAIGVPLLALLAVIPGVGILVRLLTRGFGNLCCAGLGRSWQDTNAELSAAVGDIVRSDSRPEE